MICVYVSEYVNVYCGLYFLLNFVIENYECVWVIIVCFLNVLYEDEVIFILGVIEGINLVFYVWVVLCL